MIKKAILENESSFPEHFVRAITEVREKKDYDFSITELMRPLQIIYLQRNHNYEIDALKNTKALLGTAFHFYMESQKVSNPDDFIMEQRYYKTIEGMKISGQFDLYQKSTLTFWDYKTSGMYKIGKVLNSQNLLADAKEWVIQINCYKYMSGLPCEKIKIMAVMTDFKNNNNYNLKSPVAIIELPVLKDEAIEKWIKRKIQKIKYTLEAGEYPECDIEETWRGIRCKDWCDVNEFCEQYAKNKQR